MKFLALVAAAAALTIRGNDAATCCSLNGSACANSCSAGACTFVAKKGEVAAHCTYA